MTPEKLVEEMAKEYFHDYRDGQNVKKDTAEDMLRIVLKEIQDGGVVTTMEVITNGVRWNKPFLTDEYQKWMELCQK